jgi:hypothetical protein
MQNKLAQEVDALEQGRRRDDVLDAVEQGATFAIIRNGHHIGCRRPCAPSTSVGADTEG